MVARLEWGGGLVQQSHGQGTWSCPWEDTWQGSKVNEHEHGAANWAGQATHSSCCASAWLLRCAL